MQRIIEILLGAVIGTGILMAINDALAHGAYRWIMENPQIRHCCGPDDCRPVAVRDVRFEDGRWYVAGVPVPAGQTYLSGAPGAHAHVCYITAAEPMPRCLFIPGFS